MWEQGGMGSNKSASLRLYAVLSGRVGELGGSFRNIRGSVGDLVAGKKEARGTGS